MDRSERLLERALKSLRHIDPDELQEAAIVAARALREARVVPPPNDEDAFRLVRGFMLAVITNHRRWTTRSPEIAMDAPPEIAVSTTDQVDRVLYVRAVLRRCTRVERELANALASTGDFGEAARLLGWNHNTFWTRFLRFKGWAKKLK